MKLHDFIDDGLDAILAGWESEAAGGSDGSSLPARRAHAGKVLRTVAEAMKRQLASDEASGDMAPPHASPALASTEASRLVAEYGSLRLSVLREWKRKHPEASAEGLDQVARFDAAMDGVLAELLATFVPDKPRDLFLGVLSHELRTSISAILMSAQIQLRQSTPGSASAKAGQRILKSCERVRRTLDALSDFTEVSLGNRLPVSPRPSDLGVLCGAVMASPRVAELGRAVQLVLEGDLKGEWDEERMREVIVNLLANASRYAAKDTPLVLRALGSDAESVTLTVQSAGIPIDAETLLRVFDPFVTGDADSTTYAGLGVGLFIVREIVDAHGGSVSVDVSSQAGTTFTVLLPRVLPAGAHG